MPVFILRYFGGKSKSSEGNRNGFTTPFSNVKTGLTTRSQIFQPNLLLLPATKSGIDVPSVFAFLSYLVATVRSFIAYLCLMPKPFLTAEWRNLLMANYVIDPAILKPYLPCRTELDTFNDKHYVSLVGFLFANTKVLGLSFPFHRTFEEVNLRFYVRYKEDGSWKRGVVFIKEIVPKHVIAFIANSLYGEKYATHRMKHEWLLNPEGFNVAYSWKVGREWNYLKATAEKEASAIIGGSEEEFITEHYWGYTFINQGCSGTYQVQHPRWKVHKVNSYTVRCQTELLYGPQFTEALAQPPSSVFLAEGSPVNVMKGTKIFAPASL